MVVSSRIDLDDVMLRRSDYCTMGVREASSKLVYYSIQKQHTLISPIESYVIQAVLRTVFLGKTNLDDW